jgi:hypothetical protein
MTLPNGILTEESKGKEGRIKVKEANADIGKELSDAVMTGIAPATVPLLGAGMVGDSATKAPAAGAAPAAAANPKAPLLSTSDAAGTSAALPTEVKTVEVSKQVKPSKMLADEKKIPDLHHVVEQTRIELGRKEVDGTVLNAAQMLIAAANEASASNDKIGKAADNHVLVTLPSDAQIAKGVTELKKTVASPESKGRYIFNGEAQKMEITDSEAKKITPELQAIFKAPGATTTPPVVKR